MRRAVVAEALGSGGLLAVVVGSGIMAERLCGGSEGLALLCNALATGAGLYALILTLGPLSGAHFNPAVSLSLALRGALPWPRAAAAVAAQCGGALAGVWLAHAMFGLPILQASAHVRAGWPLWISEAVATLGLLGVITSAAQQAPRNGPLAGPTAVAAWVVAAYWFTGSTAFANPAVTLARAWTDTFAGIRPTDAPLFWAAQAVGVLLSLPLAALLSPPLSPPPPGGSA